MLSLYPYVTRLISGHSICLSVCLYLLSCSILKHRDLVSISYRRPGRDIKVCLVTLLVYILPIEVESFQFTGVREHKAFLLFISEPAVQLTNGNISHEQLPVPVFTEEGL